MAADVEVRSLLLDNELKASVSFNTDPTASESTPVSTGLSNKSNIFLKMHPTSCDIQVETNGDINSQSHRDADDSCHTSRMPPGWIREVRQRKAGKTAGKLDVYITR